MSSLGPGLEKRAHPTKGHALYAIKAFAASASIHLFTPAILLPQTSHLEILCSHCLRQPPDGSPPRACTRCHAAYYCSQACQAANWKAVHAKECKPLTKLKEREGEGRLLPTLVRAALQAAVKDDIGQKLEGLEGHTSEWTKSERWDGRGMRVASAALAMYSGRKDMTMDLAASILTKVCWTQTPGGSVGEPWAALADRQLSRSKPMPSTDMIPTSVNLASSLSLISPWQTTPAFPMLSFSSLAEMPLLEQRDQSQLEMRSRFHIQASLLLY